MMDRARAPLFSRGIGFRLLLALLFVVGPGCSTLGLGGGDTGEIVYAASADLPVRATPFATSKAIGRLALHEAVTRMKVERGFAHVVTRRDLEGWVDNGELLSRLPGAEGAAKPAGNF